MNDLFEGVTDTDLLPFALHISGKMLENETLAKQAAANSKEQFDASPDFKDAMIQSVADGFDSYSDMAKQVLNSPAHFASRAAVGKLWRLVSLQKSR